MKETNLANCESSLFCKWNGDVVDCPNPNSAAAPATMQCASIDSSTATGTAAGNTAAYTAGSATGTTAAGIPFWDTKQCTWTCPVAPSYAENTCTHKAAAA